MCYPLQSSPRCISVAKAYRAKSKNSLAASISRIGTQPCFHSNFIETSGRIHSPPTSASACLLPLSLLKRSSAVSTVWMNATTLIRRHRFRATQALSTHLPKRTGLSPRRASSIGHLWTQIAKCAGRSTFEMRTLETMIRLIGRASTWY
jgi:hypothetical protein